MKRGLWLLMAAVLLSAGSCQVWQFGPSDRDSDFFSFEAGMQGWQARGTDLDDPPVDWSVQRSDELADDGTTALKLYLDNQNDRGKIWIERAFPLLPDQNYRVNVRYALASADFGQVNLWGIITGASAEPPHSAEDLVYPDNTGNGADDDVGFVWLDKGYCFDASTGPDGLLYVFVGIWGVWEAPRSYYLDGLTVTFTEQ